MLEDIDFDDLDLGSLELDRIEVVLASDTTGTAAHGASSSAWRPDACSCSCSAANCAT